MIDLRKHVFDRGDDAFKELLFISEYFEEKGDFFNAGYFYRRASESSLFPTNEKSGISTATEKSVKTSVFYGNKSLECFKKIIQDKNETSIRKSASCLEITEQFRLHSVMSKKLGENPTQDYVNEIKEIASKELVKHFKTIVSENEKTFLFNVISYDFCNNRINRGPGLFQLLIDSKDFQTALELGEKYENEMYFDDKGWLYVAKAFVDEKNKLANLEKAADLFSKDTHENHEKYSKEYGRSGRSSENVSLWANFFKGQTYLLQKPIGENEAKDLLKNASNHFKAITNNHLFPSATFLTVICEGLSNFIETKSDEIFNNLENELTKLLLKYTENKESPYKEISIFLKKGFEYFKINPSAGIVENIELKKAIELISTLDNWSHLNIFNEHKQEVIDQVSFLVSGRLEEFEKVIMDFEKLLNSQVGEEILQTFLTKNPILFGSEYKEIKPKHSLGGEYYMDYALRTHNDVYHIVEIEKSRDMVYTKSGDPSSQLTHAEQQVLDWLIWLEQNNSYGQKFLPGILSPKGFVIIGRNVNLSPEIKTKLYYRNLMWNEKINVLTFDDLLEKAKIFLENLKKI